MDEDKNNIVVSPDELKADEEATKEVKEDELRDKLAEEFGLNPEEDADLLEKLVNREKSHHEKLIDDSVLAYGVIGPRIGWTVVENNNLPWSVVRNVFAVSIFNENDLKFIVATGVT